ncbi:hypothetical protein D3C84_1260710 [compost metagenome]
MRLSVEQRQRQIATSQQFFKLCATLCTGARHDKPHTRAQRPQALRGIEKQRT